MNVPCVLMDPQIVVWLSQQLCYYANNSHIAIGSITHMCSHCHALKFLKEGPSLSCSVESSNIEDC